MFWLSVKYYVHSTLDGCSLDYMFYAFARKELSCNCYQCLLLNIALFLGVGVLWPHMSGMTLCWPLNPHWLTVICFYVLIVNVD